MIETDHLHVFRHLLREREVRIILWTKAESQTGLIQESESKWNNLLEIL